MLNPREKAWQINFVFLLFLITSFSNIVTLSNFCTLIGDFEQKRHLFDILRSRPLIITN